MPKDSLRAFGRRLVRRAMYVGTIAVLFFPPGYEGAADIIFDGTVGKPGVLSGPHVNIGEIHGKLVGNTLFHSFYKFSIDKGESATFGGRDSITGIVSRVTGNDASRIYGALRSTIPNADFYLINPNGIIFGPDAVVNIDGAFYASTAESLRFDTGEIFEARADGRVPIVATARPAEFGFLGDSAGDIVLEEGSQLHSLEAASLSAGNIEIRDGAIIGAGGYENDPVNSITLIASKSIEIGGTTPSAEQENGIKVPQPFGAALIAEEKVYIEAPHIRLEKGGNVAVLDARTEVFPYAAPGVVLASDITLIASESVVLESSDLTSVGKNGSSILIKSPDIQLNAGTRVETDGNGNGGRVYLIASETLTLSGRKVEKKSLHPRVLGARFFEGFDLIKTRSGSSVTTRVAGPWSFGGFEQVKGGSGSSITASGRITVEAPVTRFKDGTEVSTNGVLTFFTTRYLDDTGTLANAVSTSFDHGNISITANQLEVEDSVISASVVGEGGNITITPIDGSVEGGLPLTEQSIKIVNSTIDAESPYAGRGGNIFITNDDVFIDGSTVTARSNSGGGRVQVNALRYLSRNSIIDGSGGLEIRNLVLEDKRNALSTAFLDLPSSKRLDITALMRPPCTRSTGQGMFAVAPRRGLPLSPERHLISFEGARSSDMSRVSTGKSVTEATLARAKDDASAADPGILGDSLRVLAEAQQEQGRFEESVQTLLGALALAEEAGDATGMASSLGSLGNALLATGHSEAAEHLLTRAIVLSKQADQLDLTDGILNNLGNQQASSRAYEKALATYLESVQIASGTGDTVQEAKALSNAASTALQLEKYDLALELLDKAFQRVAQVSPGQDQVVIAIHLARSYAELAETRREHRTDALLHAYTVLKQAIEISEQLDDDLNLSYALGNLGTLYQSENRYKEALYLTRRALITAEQAQATESVYRWHWQEGQLLWAQGHADEAIAAFRRAVAIIEDTHQESLAQYGSASAHFQKTIAPVYLQLVDALLQRAVRTGDERKAQLLRFEARATVEQFKAAELRDYFRDECVADLEAKSKRLEAVSPSAAVVYPIMLPDRLELLVSMPGGLEQYTVPVPSKRLTETIQEFRVLLEGRRDTRVVSIRLYKWLVQPYAGKLAKADIDTLVFVPDGLLRTIPMAALHDGSRYLIDQYSVAVTPGLALIDPHPIERKKAKLLLAGLSQSVQGYPALVHVPDELLAVQHEYGGRILLDKEFTLDKVQESFEAESPSIVHIASHGRFTGDPRSSYLLTYDGRLSMDRLNAYVGTTQYRDQPLELLVLSACETAAGDERAALGLAGVGVRAGARSALGSLWSISDEATSQLIAEFYRQLKTPGVSKAQALQQAQLKLIDSPRFSHPFYWSPFLLINNWL